MGQIKKDFYSKILKEPKIQFLVSSGKRYVARKSLKYFIELCTEYDFAIIGIEGFQFSNKKIIPNMEYIADYSEITATSWEKYRETCNQSAIAFQEKIIIDASLFFEITILSKSEWASNKKIDH